MPFHTNVFINCHFDEEYRPMLRSIVFTALYLKMEPRLSQTVSSSNIRINQIKSHIRECKYGIHDLSRCRALKKNELPRFNMPYELGLDIGCMEYGNKRSKAKKSLILEKERFHYQKVLSDIAGQDIEHHNDDPETIIKKIRNWFSINSNEDLPGPTKIWVAFNQFNASLSANLKGQLTKKEIEEMQIGDYIKYAKDWIHHLP